MLLTARLYRVITILGFTLFLSSSADAQLLGPLSEAEEIEVGRTAAAEIEKGLQFLGDDVVTSYVSDLGQSLAARSQRSALTYQFKVVDSAEINAFALPGGFIYVNRGLIEAAENEDELAGVLGHEIAHIVARHGAEQVQRSAYANLGLSVLGAILGDGAGARIGQVAAEMATAGTFMRFTRDAEREADRLGAENVAAAGHDPRGMITFFEKLDALRDGQANAVERFFASHPQPEERIANIQDLLSPQDGRGGVSASQDAGVGRESFDRIARHLATLPPPPLAADSAESAPAPESDGAVASSGSATGTSPVDPSPVTYQGADQDYRIAARFAPVFHQALGSSPRFDYITRVDFDGDWRGDNNWNNADDGRELAASVYFNVSESLTHYFIHYAVFHPRDYKGGNVRGVILSEILREGVARHGDYDPTGLAESAVLAHENDMEGALVVVEKASGLFGSTRVVYVETLAHNQFLQYKVERRLFGRRGDGILVDDEHPGLFIEPKGHGIEGFHSGDQLADADGVVVYRYTGEAEEPRGLSAAGGTENVGYDLVSMAETLWPFARDRLRDLYAGAFDYRTWAVQVLDGDSQDGLVREHEVTLGKIGSSFRGNVGGRNMARPPWGWYDQDEQGEEGRRQGEWFLTPAETIKRHFGLDDDFSTTYLHHPVLGVMRAPSR